MSIVLQNVRLTCDKCEKEETADVDFTKLMARYYAGLPYPQDMDGKQYIIFDDNTICPGCFRAGVHSMLKVLSEEPSNWDVIRLYASSKLPREAIRPIFEMMSRMGWIRVARGSEPNTIFELTDSGRKLLEELEG